MRTRRVAETYAPGRRQDMTTTNNGSFHVQARTHKTLIYIFTPEHTGTRLCVVDRLGGGETRARLGVGPLLRIFQEFRDVRASTMRTGNCGFGSASGGSDSIRLLFHLNQRLVFSSCTICVLGACVVGSRVRECENATYTHRMPRRVDHTKGIQQSEEDT